MAQISEITGDANQLKAVLRAGLETLDLKQTVDFVVYTQVILPLDGYVFWKPGVTVTFQGSLHYAQDIQQSADETVGFANVIFTSESQITDLALGSQNQIYIATLGSFRFAFSRQDGFYQQAGLWHYFGHSVYPALESQLLDPPVTIDQTRAIVSNSLPFWLQLNNYQPAYGGYGNTYTLYPSFEVAQNIPPPYIVVDINPTDAIQAVPLTTQEFPHTQLVRDHVVVTLYGLQNNECLTFQDAVNQYSLDTDNIGLMNMPVMRDEHRTQAELQTIAMKKTIEYDISYYQSRSIAVAQQLIEEATFTLIVSDTIPS